MNIVRTAALLAFMTALFMAVGYLVAGGYGILIALLAAMGINLFSYWNSDKIVLRMYGAKEVNQYSIPQYYRLVKSLARRAGLPQPHVYIIDTPQPNAFATGRDPHTASVAATTGLLKSLSYNELAGVIAHELAHIQHRDILIMTLTAMLAGAISMLGNFALFFGYNRDSENNNSTTGIVGTLLAVIVAPFAAMLVQMAISRTREYDADRRGAEICGNPLWLASALKKISLRVKETINEEAEHNPATAHLFIVNPLSGGGRDHLFSTHPTTENRVAALVKMAKINDIRGGDHKNYESLEPNEQTTLQSRPKWMQTNHKNKKKEE